MCMKHSSIFTPWESLASTFPSFISSFTRKLQRRYSPFDPSFVEKQQMHLGHGHTRVYSSRLCARDVAKRRQRGKDWRLGDREKCCLWKEDGPCCCS
mmetsp:Transcript_105665/g.169978  ORF Transcript_105665/g.169978 Transcript_105665/m.169978 type:complete len:97 (+) Transcript_105665:89-379(+)